MSSISSSSPVGKQMAPLSKPEDDKWGAESPLAVVHPSCLLGTETQESRCEWGHIPWGHQEGVGHQPGSPTPTPPPPQQYQIDAPPPQHLKAGTWLLGGSPLSHQEAFQMDKLFMLCLSVLYLPTLIKEKKASVDWVLAVSQLVWRTFSLNSYNSPTTWAFLPSLYREIVSLLKDTQLSEDRTEKSSQVCVAGRSDNSWPSF